MRKKNLLIVLAAILLFTLIAACGGGEDAPAATPAESAAETTEPTASSETTDEDGDAAANNAAIPEDEVQLIQFEEPKAGDVIATVTTSMGEIKLHLFPEQAPRTVENFVGLSEKGYYNGVPFHRIVDGFMIQGGDPTGTGRGGESFFSTGAGDKGYFEDEFSMDLWNFRGAISMANTGQPGTNSSQFFIVQRSELTEAEIDQMQAIQFPDAALKKYQEIGGTPSLDWKHTVFGMVVEGMDVVDAIAAVETVPNEQGEKSVPVEPVIIENIVIATME